MAIRFEVKTVVPSVVVTLRRRNHEGLGEGLWHFDFWWNGKRHRGPTRKMVEREARGVAREAVEKTAAKKPDPVAGLTLQQAITMSLETRWPGEPVGNRSYNDAKERLENFAKLEGGATCLPALNLGGAIAIVQSFINKRVAQGLTGRTIRNDQIVISTFFTWLLKQRDKDGRELVDWKANPAARPLLTLPTPKKVVLPDLNHDELRALLAVAPSSEIWPVIVLCLGAGFRPSGACRSPWSKFDLVNGTFRVMEKNVERQVTLSDWTKAQLCAWKLAHPPANESETLWPHHVNTAHETLQRLRKAHGLSQNTTLQAMRRTADNLLYEAGLMPQEAAHLMGHSVRTAEAHYIRWKGADKKKTNKAWDMDRFSKPEAKASHETSHGKKRKRA